MREIRTSGSEGGGTTQELPTPIQGLLLFRQSTQQVANSSKGFVCILGLFPAGSGEVGSSPSASACDLSDLADKVARVGVP